MLGLSQTRRELTLALGRGLAEPYRLLWAHRDLLYRVVATTLRQRHAGSMLGMTWLVLAPALMLVTYAYMFVAVLGIRPPALSVEQYIVHMICGLLLFLTTSQALASATGSLSQEPGLLLNHVFPAELFPVREVLAASPVLLLAFLLAPLWAHSSGTFGLVWLLLPPVLILTMMTLVGCGWILSLANLVIRDTSQILGFVLTLLMLTSPIAYEVSMLPKGARFLVDLNPFAYYVRSFQEIVVHGRAPNHLLLASIIVV